MSVKRMRRVNEVIREVLSEAAAAGLKDPRIGFVTITSVDTTADLRSARVYVSVLGDERAREETLAGLERSRGYLQLLIGKELGLKRTPLLSFVHDESINYGFRIDRLLQKMESEE